MSADELGRQAYQKMMLSEYKEAVNILNGAIIKHRNDSRLYVNRCNSFIQLQDYEKAMNDALHLTENFPDNPRGYFLTGEIYLLLCEYEEAETQFAETLKMVKKSIEVEEKLFESRMQQILAKGYEVDVARKALRLAHSAKEALRYLDSGLIKNGDDSQRDIRFKLTEEEDAYFGKEFEKLDRYLEAGGVWSAGKTKQVLKKPKAVKLKAIDPLVDPANPLKCSSLWIGNVSEDTQESNFRQLFSQCGTVKSLSILADKNCAFVNYTTPEAAGKAMKEIQGNLYKGLHLVLKYQITVSAPVKKK